MAQSRKPTPKTQQQLSNEYNGANSLLGNPNLADPNFNGPNRSLQDSFEGDTVKPFTVGIQDIDEAVMYYFQNVIRPFVLQNGNRIEVPVIYGSPERWKSFQKDGYYRDKNGAIMLPLIAVKRDTISKDRSVTNKLDSNQPNLYATFQKAFNPKNFYSNFAALNNRIPVKTFHAVTVPDYVTLEYSCIVQTYYMEQLNKIIEAIEYASDAYWGDPERFKFRAFIDQFTTATELSAGQDRLVKGTFTIRLRGYIIPDTLQKDLNSIKKVNSKSKIIIQVETTSNSDIFDPNIRKLSDGRTRKDRDTEGRINSVGEVIPGREVQSPDPGSELRS